MSPSSHGESLAWRIHAKRWSTDVPGLLRGPGRLVRSRVGRGAFRRGVRGGAGGFGEAVCAGDRQPAIGEAGWVLWSWLATPWRGSPGACQPNGPRRSPVEWPNRGELPPTLPDDYLDPSSLRFASGVHIPSRYRAVVPRRYYPVVPRPAKAVHRGTGRRSGHRAGAALIPVSSAKAASPGWTLCRT